MKIHKKIRFCYAVIFSFLMGITNVSSCLSKNARMESFLNSWAPRISSLGGLFSNEVTDTFEVTRLNAPGQRFTATHGITATKGQEKLFLFVVDRPDANYMAVSSNIAIQETRGGPDRYELYMKFGAPATPIDYDLRSTLTSSDSYVGDVLYSRDITVKRPEIGDYYFLLVAHKDFNELLITAILDTPPDDREAKFTIRRMGLAN